MTTIRTLTLPHHTITITIRKERKPHPMNTREYGKRIKARISRMTDNLRKFVWENLND